MSRASDDVVCCVAVTFEQEVGFADCIRLGVDLLAVKMGGHLLAVGLRNLLQDPFRNGEHASGAAGAVVEQVGGGSILPATGRNMRLAMSRTASRGVQCSTASSLFSSLKRRTSSSTIE